MDQDAMGIRIDIGDAAVAALEVQPLGVIVPFSRCSGVRAAPVPGALGGLAATRTTLSSEREGWP
jgi:hypothetical protein